MDDVFIGRQTELAEIIAAIAANRLVTIVGAPGVGKTRLAAEVTAQLGSGFDIIKVDLTRALGVGGAARAVAGSLGLPEAETRTAAESSVAAIGERQVLVSLDNCEHVLDEVAELLPVLIATCPNLNVLATSREMIGADGEFVSALSPLAVPDPGAKGIASYAAVALFVARAGSDFVLDAANAEAVAEICRRLDGLPLAIKLAGARAAMLAPDQLVQLIGLRLPIVVADSTDNDSRHRNLDAAIAWSWDLLSPAEQALLRRLWVFSGGATAAAIRRVCVGDNVSANEVDLLLERLVDHSLVVSADSRFFLLETVRHFSGQELMRAGEPSEFRNRHALWATDLAQEAEGGLVGPSQRKWIARLDTEADNLRAAMDWLLIDQQIEAAMRLVSALALWWRANSALAEGRKWFRAAIQAAANEEPTTTRAKALFGAALLANVQGDIRVASVAAGGALHIARRLGDVGISARALLVLGSCNLLSHSLADAASYLHECVTLAHEVDDTWCRTYGLAILANVTGDRAYVDEAVELARASGDSIALAFCLCAVASWAPDPVSLRSVVSEALLLTSDTSSPEQAAAFLGMGRVEIDGWEWSSAEAFLARAHDAAWRADSCALVEVMHQLARVAHARGDLGGARSFLERSLAYDRHTGAPNLGVQLSLARVAADQGYVVAATDLVDRTEAYCREHGFIINLAQALLVRGDLLRSDNRVGPAREAVEEALRFMEACVDRGGVADCLDDLAGFAIVEGSYANGVTLIGAASFLRESRALRSFPPDHPHYDADCSTARERLSAAKFNRAWKSGKNLRLEDAVELSRTPPAAPMECHDEEWSQLTEKELAVVQLVGAGLTNRQVAERLNIAENTVRVWLQKARAKLGPLSRSALGAKVREQRR